MVMLLLTDGTKVEIEHCRDVVHVPGQLVCVGDTGASVATFLTEDVLGYSLNSHLVKKFRGIPKRKLRRRHPLPPDAMD